MNDPAKALYGLFGEVRSCFNRLKMLAEKLHGDSGITPAMRAVLETLVGAGPLTVPEIARLKAVSRQHIQMIVNALLADRLVETTANPLHQKSPIIALTPRGAQAFAALAQREKEPLRMLAATLDLERLGQARSLLAVINHLLQNELTKGDPDDAN